MAPVESAGLDDGEEEAGAERGEEDVEETAAVGGPLGEKAARKEAENVVLAELAREEAIWSGEYVLGRRWAGKAGVQKTSQKFSVLWGSGCLDLRSTLPPDCVYDFHTFHCLAPSCPRGNVWDISTLFSVLHLPARGEGDERDGYHGPGGYRRHSHVTAGDPGSG